uniref:Uncharacterized protein n=1 Tax=Cacopsylla melanoneura TaxID=428564 RepID=A0A8D8PVB1_9HEMI
MGNFNRESHLIVGTTVQPQLNFRLLNSEVATMQRPLEEFKLTYLKLKIRQGNFLCSSSVRDVNKIREKKREKKNTFVECADSLVTDDLVVRECCLVIRRRWFKLQLMKKYDPHLEI